MSEDLLHPLHAARRQRSLILRVVRSAFFIIIVTVALLVILNETDPDAPRSGIFQIVKWWTPLAMALVLFGIGLAIDLLTPNKKVSTISGVLLGMFAGLLGAVCLSLLIDLVMNTWFTPLIIQNLKPFTMLIKVLVGITLCYLGIVTVLQTQDEFRLVIPYVEFAKQVRGVKPLLLDTSALVDARIVDIAATSLIQSALVIPRFVIAELQALSDSQDKLKRARGRRGLEAIGRLQRTGRVDISIEDAPPPGVAVDQALIDLAVQLSARILTTDAGLSRVAQIQGVIVINLHEVAAALRPTVVPGEQLRLHVIKRGEQAGQGVAYLDDGTMVVIEHAADRVGDEVVAMVSSSMQTAAGRLVFARLQGGDGAGAEQQPSNASPTPVLAPEQPAAHEALAAEHSRPEQPPEQRADHHDEHPAPAATPTERLSPPGRAPSGAPGAGAPPIPGVRREPTGRNPRR
jgi:uncharacterized protein YacL